MSATTTTRTLTQAQQPSPRFAPHRICGCLRPSNLTIIGVAACSGGRVDVRDFTAVARNVLGGELEPCSFDPLTGWFRDGCCNTDSGDHGVHTVCAVMTAEFLKFSKAAGNDLSTPRPMMGFVGLSPGDHWCLCAPRWAEALAAGAAPEVVLEATHARTLEWVDLDDLKVHRFTG